MAKQIGYIEIIKRDTSILLIAMSLLAFSVMLGWNAARVNNVVLESLNIIIGFISILLGMFTLFWYTFDKDLRITHQEPVYANQLRKRK